MHAACSTSGAATGTFACLLAGQGLEAVGVDPAVASLDQARAKPGADRVLWLHGDATTLPPLQVDLATMTANVAQVFVTDAEWTATLRGIHSALAPDGHLVFETRVPSQRAWESWTHDATFDRADVAGFGLVESWTEVTVVEGQLVTFHDTWVLPDGRVLHSDSTLRFRERDEIQDSLGACGFVVEDVRDAPDRPGREWVFIARAR